jgi:hypothetical protein
MAEREAAGSRWPGAGRVFTAATGTPLGAKHIRRVLTVRAVTPAKAKTPVDVCSRVSKEALRP